MVKRAKVILKELEANSTPIEFAAETRLKMKVKATFNIILPLKALMRYLKYLKQRI